MTEFGNTLRQAREAKGMSIAQVSEITRMAPTTIEDLEKEDFSRIAAPIYGRGFVKLYCEAVGLDSRPMVQMFMAALNGELPQSAEPAAAESPVEPPSEPEPVTAPEPPPAPSPIPTVTEPPAEPEFHLEAEEIRLPEPPPAPATEPFFDPEAPRPGAGDAQAELFPREEPAPRPSLSRYAAPLKEASSNAINGPVTRLGLLAAVALVIIYLAFLGVRALYRSTNGPALPDADAAGQEQTAVTDVEPHADSPRPAATGKPDAAPAPRTAEEMKPREPQKIPALYID